MSRDWFLSAEEPNPVRSAQQAMKPVLPKRFYKEAAVEERNGAFHLTLDGRLARTPGRQPLAVPNRDLAAAMAEEWQRQGSEINPATMPITRIVNSALDGVAARRQEVVDDLVKYAGSDLVAYRAAEPDRLVAEQSSAWDPVLEWARDALGARVVLAEGVVHAPQPDATLAAIRQAIERVSSPLGLASLHVMTTLTGSVLIALAQALGRLDADEAWKAAHVDEAYQESVWGQDHEAKLRRDTREAEFKAASLVYRLAGA